CKMKLAFIDGTFPRPPAGSSLFEQWRRADLMVTSYLWNTISKDIVEAFMCRNSGMNCFVRAPSPKCTSGGCTCGVNKAIGEMFSSTQHYAVPHGASRKLRQRKSQLLMMDPLPDLEKAFSMIFAVEQQRNVQTQIAKVSLRDNKKEGNYRQIQRRKTSIDK
ncbi:UNVERIFIED_CONTAM: hypothetical protein Sindi_2487300, partial [Sesamum indicum]